MTTPDERLNALIYARDFMLDLLNPKLTPRVPSAIRTRAYNRLKHYPSEWEIAQITTERAKIFFGSDK